MMQAVILAGGEGYRLRPLTKNRPKAMIKVGNRPIIEYVIEALLANGIRDILVVVGYQKEQAIQYLNNRKEEIRILVQERQLGTAHALACAQPYLEGEFLVLPGDNWVDADSIARIKGEQSAMLIKEHSHPSNFGVVELKGDRVTQILEKPPIAPSHLVSTGILSLNTEFFSYPRTNEIPDTLMQMIRNGVSIRAIEAAGWQDAIVPWDLFIMNSLLLRQLQSRKSGSVNRNVVIRGPISIGKGTILHPNTVITGPVIIGEDCEIGPQVTIDPNTAIGPRVRIAPYVHIAQSLIMEDTFIGPSCYLDTAIVGERCTLPSHTVTQIDTSPFKVGEKYWDASFGAILGDDISAAPFTVFRNCIVGNNTVIKEGRVIQKLVPDDTLVM